MSSRLGKNSQHGKGTGGGGFSILVVVLRGVGSAGREGEKAWAGGRGHFGGFFSSS